MLYIIIAKRPHRARHVTTALRVALMSALAPSLLGAQAAAPAGHAQQSDAARLRDTVHALPLFTHGDARVATGFVVGTLILVPLDRPIEHELQLPRTQASRTRRDAARIFNTLGGVGAPLIGITLYGVGRVGHSERVADVGLHGTEAIVLSTAVATVIKEIVGRARPSAAVDDPDQFALGRGQYSSLPSGHTTAAFAAATVVTLETTRWWPHSTRYVAPLMYGGATMVGLARLYSNTHWATDVATGAGIGTITGLAVVRFQHTHPGNRLDRWLLGAATSTVVMPDGHGGVALAWSIESRD